MTRLYDNINATQLQRDADEHLMHYGTAFHPEIITSTEGIFMETASGHRMMDVRIFHVLQLLRIWLTRTSSQAGKCQL